MTRHARDEYRDGHAWLDADDMIMCPMCFCAVPADFKDEHIEWHEAAEKEHASWLQRQLETPDDDSGGYRR